MQNVGRKVMGTVISAVLLLYMAFPISDFQKPERAYANPGVLVIFGTAAAAGGLLIGGATLAQYNVNLESVAQGFENATSQWSASWSQYVQDQGSFSNAMNSCVTAQGTINLETLSDAGFFDSLHTYSAYCVQQGTMVQGTPPSDAFYSYIDVNGIQARTFTGEPPYYAQIVANYENTNRRVTGTVVAYSISSVDYHMYVVDNPGTFTLSSRTTGGVQQVNATASNTVKDYRYYIANGSYSYSNISGALGWKNADELYLNAGCSWIVNENAANVDYGSTSSAVVTPDVVNGTATAPTSTVQPFEPTAEQLSNGYSSADIVDAINSGNAQTNASLDSILSAITTTLGGVLNDIKTGVNGLETTIGNALTGALGSVLSGISTTVGTISTTLGDIWGGVQGWYTDWLAWVGATPLGQLIAQIIAALQAGVISLSQAIAAVQTAVQTAVTDLVGAIESIQIPTFELPPVTLPYANLNGGSGTADLMDGSAAHVSAFQSLLNDKEPFCYLFAFSNGMQQVQANNSAARFRIQHRFDILGQPLDVDINAEPYLLRDVGGTTIADLLRSSMTLTLCMGLLYSAYRTALRAVKS